MIKYQKECENVYDYIQLHGVSYTAACKALGYKRQTLSQYYKDFVDMVDISEVAAKPIPYIATPNNVSFVWNDEINNVSSASNKLNKIKELLNCGDGESAFKLSSLKTQIESYQSTHVTIEDGELFYKNTKMEGAIVQRIISEMEEGNPEFEKYVLFIENLMSNPSQKMKKRIYDFLQAKDIEISADGYILAFKAVRSDYLDIHSGTMDNSVGKTLKMDRPDVDDDDSVTCSHGLHLCSKSYIPNFASYSSRIVLCKLNPRDVVSIPNDYNDAKLRCCEYTVLEDVTDKFNI